MQKLVLASSINPTAANAIGTAFHNLLAVPRQAMPPMTDDAMSMLIAAIHILRREPCNLSGSAKVLGSGSNSTRRVSCDTPKNMHVHVAHCVCIPSLDSSNQCLSYSNSRFL